MSERPPEQDAPDEPAPERLEATLERLSRERAEADRRYNDALTALDRAIMRSADLAAPSPPFDDYQLETLNESWAVATRPTSRGWKGRIAAIVWRVVGPSLEKQTTFNSRVVDHVNRNAAAARASHQALTSAVGELRGRLADLIAFESQLIAYLQQITAYVDTRDRDVGGRALIVNAAVNGVADNLAKRWESMVAREQRFDAAVASLSAAQTEIRTLASVSQQASLSTKRELERLLKADAASIATPAAPQQSAAAFAHRLDSYKYVGFEDQFRGSQEAIRQRLESYLPIFDGASDVLDVGCGRGEFLDLLQGRGITARGLDLNHEMVEVCRARGLDVEESDVVSLPGAGGRRIARRAVRRAGRRTSGAGLPVAVSGARASMPFAPGLRLCSRRSIRRAGSRSSRASSGISRTSGRCIPRRCGIWCWPAASAPRRLNTGRPSPPRIDCRPWRSRQAFRPTSSRRSMPTSRN